MNRHVLHGWPMRGSHGRRRRWTAVLLGVSIVVIIALLAARNIARDVLTPDQDEVLLRYVESASQDGQSIDDPSRDDAELAP